MMIMISYKTHCDLFILYKVKLQVAIPSEGLRLEEGRIQSWGCSSQSW